MPFASQNALARSGVRVAPASKRMTSLLPWTLDTRFWPQVPTPTIAARSTLFGQVDVALLGERVVAGELRLDERAELVRGHRHRVERFGDQAVLERRHAERPRD